MRNGNRGAGFHQPLQSFLHQTFRLRIECGGGLIQNQYGRILENGAGNADTLALSAGKLAATVADIGIVTFLGVHNEIVGIGYLGSFHNLLHGGILYTESNVIEESVIKENGFLIDVSYQAAQIGDTRILDIKTVYQYLARLYIVVAGQQIHQCGFSGTGLPYQCDSLAFGHGQVDMLQYLAGTVVAEADVLEFHLVIERRKRFRQGRFFNGILRKEYLVDTLHGGKSFGNVVSGFGEFLQRVDNAVQYHQVVNERGGVYSSAVAQNQRAAEPQHDNDDACTQKLAHGMRQCLAGGYPVDSIAVFVAALIETLHHLVFGNEGFNDTQPAQGFFQLRHGIAPLCLRIQRLPFQFLAYRAHYPAHARKHQQREQRQLPTDGYQCAEIGYNQYRVLYQHIQRTGNGCLHLGNVAAHAGYDIAFPFFGKETQRQVQHLIIYLRTDVAHHARAERNHHGGRGEIGECFQQGHHRQEDA